MESVKRKPDLLIKKITPIAALEPYVDFIWHVKDEMGEYAYYPNRLIPQGNFEMVFDLKNSSSLNYEGLWEDRPKLCVGGLLKKFYLVKTNGPSDFIGVVFKPGKFQRLISATIDDIRGKILPFSEVFNQDGDQIYEELLRTSSDDEKYLIIQNFLLELLKYESKVENAFIYWAIEKINFQKGDINVAALAKDIRVSERHLRRKFKQVVGFSPKFFAKLIRLGYVLQTIELAKRQNQFLNEMPSITSYFDQSHFIRDFQSIVGISPKSYLQESNPLTEIYLNL